MKKKFAIAVLSIGLTSFPAFAVFGIGDIVFDPSAYGELVEQLTQLEQQYSQLVKTYTMVTNQYNQMVSNAKWIVSKARWRAMLTPWTHPTATNTYGTTGGWIGAVNNGFAALAGYNQAVTRLNSYSSVWGTIGSAQ